MTQPMIVRADQIATLDRASFNPFATSCLAIDLTETTAATPDWLRRLPCPVIGIGPDTHPAAAAFDTTVPDATALAPLAANIARAPIAAMTLVQVLRATEHLPVHDALVAESLAYAALQAGVEATAWRAARPAPAPPPQDAGPGVIVDRHGTALSLRLNRPLALNAINTTLRDALTEGLALAALDASIATIALRGEGRCFSIGGALEEFGTAPDPATAHAVRCAAVPAFHLAAVAERATAFVHGACIGAGAELAGLCGRVIARPGAFFQLPELRYGLIPGSGGTVGITRRIGRQRTALLILSGRRIGASLALQWKLADKIGADPS